MLRLSARHLGKRFRRHTRAGSRSWRELLLTPWRRSPSEDFWALRDVSIELHAGEMLGVIGHNGAGKSTLLNLLGGVGAPTEGSVQIHGRIGALLDLGGGFVGDLTGRENAILAGVVAGLTRQEVLQRLDEIVAFAEIEAFLDEPVRTYSTGMAMRLAFAVAVHTDPDILLVDEFLSVGDLAFQTKCRARIERLRDTGCAIVFVTHGIEQVRDMCDRALWLSHGRVMALAAPDEVTALYETEMREETLRRTPEVAPPVEGGDASLAPKKNRFGTFEVAITRVQLRPPDAIRTGDPLEVEIHYRAPHAVKDAIFVVSMSDEEDNLYLDTSTQGAKVPVPELHGDGVIRFRAERLDLTPGRYFVNVGVFEGKWKHAYDYHWNVYPLTIDGAPGHKGLLAPPCRWEVETGVLRPRPLAALRS
jgi:lipopolysaccharide transport system ATP-binding protein